MRHNYFDGLAVGLEICSVSHSRVSLVPAPGARAAFHFFLYRVDACAGPDLGARALCCCGQVKAIPTVATAPESLQCCCGLRPVLCAVEALLLLTVNKIVLSDTSGVAAFYLQPV